MQSFVSSFNNQAEFDSYTVPGEHGTWHEWSKENVFTNSHSHKAYVLRPNDVDNLDPNNNLAHRGYWSRSFRPGLKGLVAMQLVVNATMILANRTRGINDWWSPLTVGLRPDYSRLFTLGMGPDFLLTIGHVPVEGRHERSYTQNKIRFPQGQYVKLDLLIDPTPKVGKVELYQDKVLTSAADLHGGDGTIGAVHGGLYCSPAVSNCVTYNGFFMAKEIASRNEFMRVVEADFNESIHPKSTRYISMGGVA